jgi:nitrogen-specific signal transduction histidine kinase
MNYDNNNNKLPDFSKANSVENVFDMLYRFLVLKWKIVELDLFLISDNDMSKLENISASVSLENIYNELEERGLLDFAANSNEIKIIPNIDESIEQINSIIIIPVFLFNRIGAYFIANTPLHQTEIDNSDINIIHLIAEHSFALINIHKTLIDKNTEDKKYNLLKQQILLASTQIATSELISALNDSFYIPHKIIKTNIDLLQKGIGDINMRMKIIDEQFNSIISIQNKIKNLSVEIENIPLKHDIFTIIEQATSISNPILNKFGITLSVNNSNENKVININCFRIQIIFSIYTFIANSIQSMQDGGSITIGIFENDNNTISIIISDNGSGLEKNEITGDFISAFDLSTKKMKQHFLYALAQQIIIAHKGKFSVYSENAKGTTYKIILPIVDKI